MKTRQPKRKRVRFVASTTPKYLVPIGSSGRGRSFAVKPPGVANTYAHIAAGGDAAVLIGGKLEVMAFDGVALDLMPASRRAIKKALVKYGIEVPGR